MSEPLWIGLIGTLASLCSVTSFAPQAVHVWKTRSTEGVSAAMFAITTTGFALWTAYGVALGQWPIIVTNALCLALAGFILVMLLLPARLKRRLKNEVDVHARRTSGRGPGAQRDEDGRRAHKHGRSTKATADDGAPGA